MVNRVARFGCRDVVRDGAHPADALRDARHLFHRAAFAELLKAAQLGDDHVGVFQPALLVQEQVNAPVPFQAGDRVNADLLGNRFGLRQGLAPLRAVSHTSSPKGWNPPG